MITLITSDNIVCTKVVAEISEICNIAWNRSKWVWYTHCWCGFLSWDLSVRKINNITFFKKKKWIQMHPDQRWFVFCTHENPINICLWDYIFPRCVKAAASSPANQNLTLWPLQEPRGQPVTDNRPEVTMGVFFIQMTVIWLYGGFRVLQRDIKLPGQREDGSEKYKC